STQSWGAFVHPQRQNSPLAASAADSEFSSVFDPCAQGQETHGVAYRAGKSDTPSQGAASDVGSKRSLAPVEYCHSDPGVKSVAYFLGSLPVDVVRVSCVESKTAKIGFPALPTHAAA